MTLQSSLEPEEGLAGALHRKGFLKSYWLPSTGLAGKSARLLPGPAEPDAGSMFPAMHGCLPPECCSIHIPQVHWHLVCPLQWAVV